MAGGSHLPLRQMKGGKPHIETQMVSRDDRIDYIITNHKVFTTTSGLSQLKSQLYLFLHKSLSKING